MLAPADADLLFPVPRFAGKSHIFGEEALPMWDTRPIELELHLPEDLAEDVEELQETDPEFLTRVIRYGLTRRAMFQELSRGVAPGSDPTAGSA